MPDDLIRCLLRAVIESFPINEAKKADMLRSIVGQEKTEADETKTHSKKGGKDYLIFLCY